MFRKCSILLIALLVGCTTNPPKPDGCPIPKYFAGDFVKVDDVFIGEVLELRIVGCGDILYKLKLNVEDENGAIIYHDIKEDRLSPYEPEPAPSD